MLIKMVDKQRRGVSVVKTFLFGAGIKGRSICVQVDSWAHPHGNNEQYSVFVSAPEGENVEPIYETGQTVIEAVRKVIDSIKGKANDAKAVSSAIAPF